MPAPPGYSYVAARNLDVGMILAFTTGMFVPDSTVTAQGWIVGADVVAVGTPVPQASPYLLVWQPGTFYPASTRVLNPSGQIVSSNLDHTSGAVYNPANWTAVSDTATLDYKKLLPWFAALANIANARANVVMMGASIVEGLPTPANMAKTIEAYLAAILRARFPVPGVTYAGGRGYVGVPSNAVSATWPLAFTGGTFEDNVFSFGAKHRSWYASATAKVADTLSAPVTSFDINHIAGTSGNAAGGYYKVDGGAAVSFSTLAGSTTPTKLNVTTAATTSIEVGWQTGGVLIFDGITEYAGDESRGVAVHNCGHASYSTADWQVAANTAGCWATSMALLSPKLIIMQDFGVNDFIATIGNATSAQFKTNLTALIASIRAAGMTCPILVAMGYQINLGAYTYVEPWANYVAVAKQIAAADAAVVFVDHSARMPGSADAVTYSLYHTDQIHGNANGNAYRLMAETIAAVIAPR